VTTDNNPRAAASDRPINPVNPPLDPDRRDQAMTVWDQLTVAEQRQVFQSVWEAAEAYRITDDTAHAVRLTESVHSMVTLEQVPGLTEARRRPPRPLSEQGGSMGMDALIAMLRGEHPGSTTQDAA
jgi:hypothetical protein